MQKTTFKIAKMDCPAEERIIRIKLDGLANIQSLEFDIPNRQLCVFHNNSYEKIYQRLNELKFNTSIIESVDAENLIKTEKPQNEKKILWIVLIINIGFFAIEMATGFISKSMGLVADSLDMLADGIVYGLALMAVGGTVAKQKNTAKFAAYFQFILAGIGFIEVIRRFIGIEKIPNFETMIVVAFLALIANAVCLYLLKQNKSKEAHIQASMIFTSNDIIINLGVITAGVLVNWLHSSYPDLIIGTIVFIIVAGEANKILKLSK
ncbi:MAG: cation transporter [Prevotellaceae bacterium]|jgi:Co/Zn/Cd efflux system component|nr:cation transporter [Prevotellaceae bacterium]